MEDNLSQIASNEEYTNLKTAMDKAIIYKAYTPENYFAQCGSIAIDKFSGLSIYAYQKNYPKLNDWYDQLEWATYVSKYKMRQNQNKYKKAEIFINKISAFLVSII